ncbi:MAG: GNAT family protein [archaeon]
MKIETKRLILRLPNKDDVPDLVIALNNKNVSRYMASMPYPYTKKIAQDFVSRNIIDSKSKERNKYEFNLELKSEKKIVGGVGLSNVKYGLASIGYWLREDLWGQGLMSEAVLAMIDFGFSKLKLRRIELTCSEVNSGSRAIAEKFGFKLEGVLRKAHGTLHNGNFANKCVYGLLKEDWPEVKKRMKK